MKKNLQKEIQKHYGGIARRVSKTAKSSCCGGGSCCGDPTNKTPLYSAEELAGLPEEAVNASLGCANPIALARLQKGETVLDLGSGGGIDVLISAKQVGENGKVYGLDMTDDMLKLANQNKEKSGAKNVEFIKGYLEDIPLPDESVDVITSNCVINLSESKEKALAEAYRVLRKGGRLAIADIVELKSMPDELRQSVSMWVGCISGALSVSEYERILRAAGFKDIEITPVNIYTRDILHDIAKDQKLEHLYAKADKNALDGAFAGAHVKAVK